MMTRFLFMAGATIATATAAAQPPQQGPVGLATGLQRGYAQIKMNLTRSAEKMSEADYGFRPNSEIRNFGQLFGHVANAQFAQCSGAKGVPNLHQTENFEEKATKADFLKALADSFSFCDDVFAALTDETAAQVVSQGRGQTTRGVALMGVLTHGSEMYGIATVYLRLKGLVPPSTEAFQRGRGAR